MPSPPADFQPPQGTPPQVAPLHAFATNLARGNSIYLAIWDGTPTYGGQAKGSPPCEM
jgi:hypothetical protein